MGNPARTGLVATAVGPPRGLAPGQRRFRGAGPLRRTVSAAGTLAPALLLAATTASAAAASPPADPTTPSSPASIDAPFVTVEINGSLISDVASASVLSGAFGYTIRGGYRWSGWGLFGQVEQNFWFASEHEDAVVEGAVNLGVGVDYVYGGGFVHTSLVLGPSILAFDTILDEAGTVGIFLELRPVGLRWSVHPNVVLGLDPISFALVAPVLGKIPLIFPQYRTGFTVEVGW